jgi:Cu+-exporting ATPase
MVAMAASITVVLANSFAGRVISLPRFGRKAKETHTLTLSVPTIHCDGCVADVESIVGGVSGVEGIQVDLASKWAVVTYRDGTEVEDEVRDCLTKGGHTIG